MSDTTTNQVEIVLIRHGKTEGNTKIPVSFQEGPTTKTLVTEEK